MGSKKCQSVSHFGKIVYLFFQGNGDTRFIIKGRTKKSGRCGLDNLSTWEGG